MQPQVRPASRRKKTQKERVFEHDQCEGRAAAERAFRMGRELELALEGFNPNQISRRMREDLKLDVGHETVRKDLEYMIGLMKEDSYERKYLKLRGGRAREIGHRAVGMRLQGTPITTIAKELKTTPQTVRSSLGLMAGIRPDLPGKLQNAGKIGDDMLRARRRDVADRYIAGTAVGKIAKEKGMTRTTVYNDLAEALNGADEDFGRILAQAALRRHRGRILGLEVEDYPQRKRRVIQAFISGDDRQQIADREGLSKTTVDAHIRREFRNLFDESEEG
jgi:DNA-binding NarL/FixJ family response regulator